ncbi:hypothetical protein GCM10022265_25970 [Marinobacter xestospongiae]
MQGLAGILQDGQRLLAVLEIALAFQGQPQAAGRTQEQHNAKLGLQSLDGGAGGCGGEIELPGSGGETASMRSTDKQGKIVEAFHIQKIFETGYLLKRFFNRGLINKLVPHP